MDIKSMGICEISDGIKNKKFTCNDVISSLFEEIEKIEPKINAFTKLCKYEAFEKAKKIDEKVKNNEPLGKLCGVPIAIKDNICTDGIPTTCASKMLEDFIPPYNATVIEKILKEDAIIIGKTNMDEFAMGSSTETSYYKKTKNPWDLSRVPGGSSGGSAASVASGMVPIALGSDTGGSIRQPASFCGVVGLKPTYGLVSRFGLIAFASSLDQIGPFSKTVKDAALTLEIIQGDDPLDSTCHKSSIQTDYLSTIDNGIKNMKVGILKEFLSDGLDNEINAALLDCIEKLKVMGAEVNEVSLPLANSSLSSYYIISSAEASSNLARFDGIRYGYRPNDFVDVDDLMIKSRSEGFGTEVKRRIMLGTYALSSGYYDEYYTRAQKLKKQLKTEFKNIFNEYDVILSPTSPILPFKIGEKSHDPLSMYLGDIYTVIANLAGIPAISIPWCKSKSGLPIGIQIMGPHFEEEKIFKVSYALEQSTKFNPLAQIL